MQNLRIIVNFRPNGLINISWCKNLTKPFPKQNPRSFTAWYPSLLQILLRHLYHTSVSSTPQTSTFHDRAFYRCHQYPRPVIPIRYKQLFRQTYSKIGNGNYSYTQLIPRKIRSTERIKGITTHTSYRQTPVCNQLFFSPPHFIIFFETDKYKFD